MNKTVKKIVIVFLLFIIAILLNQNKVYADEDSLDILLFEMKKSDSDYSETEIIKKLVKWYGYTMGDENGEGYIYETFALKNIELKATKIDSNSYSVKIGNEDDEITENRKYLTFAQLQALGFTGTANGIGNNGVKWKTSLKVEGVKKRKNYIYNCRCRR